MAPQEAESGARRRAIVTDRPRKCSPRYTKGAPARKLTLGGVKIGIEVNLEAEKQQYEGKTMNPYSALAH